MGKAADISGNGIYLLQTVSIRLVSHQILNKFRENDREREFDIACTEGAADEKFNLSRAIDIGIIFY